MRAAWSGRVQHTDRLVQGHRSGRTALLPFRQDDQAGYVAAYLVAGLGVPDGALQDLVYQP